MKTFLVLRVRKSALEELVFTKFDFLNLADFTINNRFLILPSTLPLSAPLIAKMYSNF